VKSVTMNIWMYRMKEGGSASDFRTFVAGDASSGEIAFLKADVSSD